MDLGLGGRGYLLTGASRGLGFATAQPQVHRSADQAEAAPRRDRSTYCMIPPLR